MTQTETFCMSTGTENVPYPKIYSVHFHIPDLMCKIQLYLYVSAISVAFTAIKTRLLFAGRNNMYTMLVTFISLYITTICHIALLILNKNHFTACMERVSVTDL